LPDLRLASLLNKLLGGLDQLQQHVPEAILAKAEVHSMYSSGSGSRNITALVSRYLPLVDFDDGAWVSLVKIDSMVRNNAPKND
jgi:hypothetical protein